jgi:hypothetical protein
LIRKLLQTGSFDESTKDTPEHFPKRVCINAPSKISESLAIRQTSYNSISYENIFPNTYKLLSYKTFLDHENPNGGKEPK